MFGILKSLVTYVSGQTNSDSEEATSYSRYSDDSISPKQMRDIHASEYQEFENNEFSVGKIEEEIRSIEGLDGERENNEKEDLTILKESEPLSNLERPISTCEVGSNVVSSREKETKINCSNDNGLELCQHRIGRVTKSFKDYAIIDDELRVDCCNFNAKKLFEGASVKYVVFRKHIDDKWQIHKMVEIEDENWEGQVKEVKVEIVKKSGAINRKIVGIVESRSGQEVIMSPAIKFSLNDVKADFIPYTGDWLSINALVELDESVQDFVGEVLAIHDFQPLRSRVISGFITSWDENRKEGVINSSVWFTQNECEQGYLPTCEDSVDVEAIECTHKLCTWRAVSVVSNVERKLKTKPNSTTMDEEKNVGKSMSSIKNGISIPRKVYFGYVGFGKMKEDCIEVVNLSKDSHLLLRGRFHGKKSESQITILSNIGEETLISPGQKILCRFRVSGRFLGQFTEYFVFQFKGFKMSCAINFEVREDKIMRLIDNKAQFCANLNDKLARTRNKELNRQGKIIMKGEQAIKPPPFVPVRFGLFPVPEHLWKIVLGEKDDDYSQVEIMTRLREVAPCLNGDLSPTNYVARFHTLLYLEEIDLNIQLHKYDLEGVTLSFVGDQYLSLEVPGLAEKRPSVLVGDKVNLESSKNPGPVYEGCVHKACSNELWLKFHPHFHQIYESEECSVSFVVSRNPIRRCHFAIELAMKHLGEDVLFPKWLEEKEPQVNLISEDRGESTVQNLYDYKVKPFASSGEVIRHKKINFSENGAPMYSTPGKNEVFPLKSAPKISKKEVQLKWFNSQLNHYQKEAVRNVVKGVCRPLPYVIFGPPGTGKTVTLVETILQIYSLVPDSRILVATPSNSSANLIAERLLISKVLSPGDLVRLVAWHCFEEGTIPESLLPYSTSCDVSACKPGDFNPITYKLKRSSNAFVLGRHRITVGTCIALGQLYSMGFPSGHFTHVCVDEAGQATEPELVIPLAFLHKDWGHAILAGDPLQLGPVISSRISRQFGLGYSYLARLLNSPLYLRDPCNFSGSGGYNPKLVTRLVMNYRSLPEILSLPSSLFYDSHLQPQVGENSLEGSILKSLAKCLPQRNSPLPPSMVFHGVRGRNFQDSDCPSWFNPQELVQIIFYLKDFLKAGISPDDIGVITPYQKQVQKLRSLLTQLEMPTPKIGSVEEFQGQERHVILLSTVRSASRHLKTDVRHALGFVASPQRLNVALTRARALLVIIGNPHLLSCDLFWKKTLSYCVDNNAYVGCDLPKDFIDYSCQSFSVDH